MRGRALAAGLAVTVLFALLAAPGAAHGWGVTAGDQVSTDGTVVLESVSVPEDAYAVIHADDAGSPGRPVGHRRVESEGGGDHVFVRVGVDESFWANATNATNGTATVTLWAAVHDSTDTDLDFEPSVEPIVEQEGTLVVDRFVVRAGDAPAYVVVLRQESEGVVTVRRAALPADGFLVLHADDAGDLGPPVGHAALAAGVHRNVTVDLDGAFFGRQSGRFGLWAVVHADDGDGAFDPADDPPVRADDGAVRSFLSVGKIQTPVPPDAGTPTHSSTHSATPTHGHSSTHSETQTHDHSSTHSATPTHDHSSTHSPSPTTSRVGTTPGSGNGAPIPGPGPVAAVVALGLALLAVRRR